MKHIYTVHKSSDSSGDKFSSAVHCAISSIKSVLYEEDVDVEYSNDELVVDFGHRNHGPSTEELLAMIIGSFQDRGGCYYPEFLCVSVVGNK